MKRSKADSTPLFHEYFNNWVNTYKAGVVQDVTLEKYKMAHTHLKNIAPDLRVADLDRQSYQEIINQHALTHERITVLDFSRQLRACIRDAMDDGDISKDPTRKVVIKGKTPTVKRKKYLNQAELSKLLASLDMDNNTDFLIYVIAKTGVRFAEALGITPADINTENRIIRINKSWNYKNPDGGFIPTKTASSIRNVEIDEVTAYRLLGRIKDVPPDEPVFVTGRMFNSTINDRLISLCKNCNIPNITLHSLRHTYASLLIYAGVSVPGVSKMLGHSNVTTTQNTYVHIVDEMKSKDSNIAMDFLRAI